MKTELLSLQEMVSDPIVIAVMNRDGLTSNDILDLMNRVKKDLKKKSLKRIV